MGAVIRVPRLACGDIRLPPRNCFLMITLQPRFFRLVGCLPLSKRGLIPINRLNAGLHGLLIPASVSGIFVELALSKGSLLAV